LYFHWNIFDTMSWKLELLIINSISNNKFIYTNIFGILLTTCEALHSKTHKLQDIEVIVIHQGSIWFCEKLSRYCIWICIAMGLISQGYSNSPGWFITNTILQLYAKKKLTLATKISKQERKTITIDIV